MTDAGIHGKSVPRVGERDKDRGCQKRVRKLLLPLSSCQGVSKKEENSGGSKGEVLDLQTTRNPSMSHRRPSMALPSALPNPGLLKGKRAPEPSEGLVKTASGPSPRVSDLVGLGKGLRICISKFPGCRCCWSVDHTLRTQVSSHISSHSIPHPLHTTALPHPMPVGHDQQLFVLFCFLIFWLRGM